MRSDACIRTRHTGLRGIPPPAVGLHGDLAIGTAIGGIPDTDGKFGHRGPREPRPGRTGTLRHDTLRHESGMICRYAADSCHCVMAIAAHEVRANEHEISYVYLASPAGFEPMAPGLGKVLITLARISGR